MGQNLSHIKASLLITCYSFDTSWIVLSYSACNRDVLLFWRNLAHIDPDTDDLAGLHPHWAGGIVATCSTHRCVAGRNGRVLYALPPRAGLPVVHSAGMVIAVPHLLQGTDVWTLDSTWEVIEHKPASVFLLYDREIQKHITLALIQEDRKYVGRFGV